MTREWRAGKRAGVTAILLATCSCAGAQLEAAQATGAAGLRVSSDDRVLAGVPALCLEIASLSGANDDCTALREQSRTWTRVIALIEAYSRTLARPTSGDMALSADMLVAGGAWTGLKPDESAAATELANVTRELQSHHPDAAAVRKAIGAADGPIQKLTHALDEAVDQRVATINLAETSIDVVRQRLQETVAALPTVARPKPAAPAPASAAAPGAKHPDKPAPTKPDDQDVRPSIAAIGVQMTALYDATNRQATANQAEVPGSLAGLAAVQNDLESKRERLAVMREGLDVFARAHKFLHDNVDQVESDALLGKVLEVIGKVEVPAPAAHPPAH